MPESPTHWPERVREAAERLRETATSAGMSAGEVQALLDGALRGDPQADAETLRVGPGEDVAPTIASPTPALGPEPSIGRDLGRYRVLHELGHGGMGVVYRAHDKTLGRDVALKVLSVGDRSDRELLDRFQREARAAAAMDHPHIVKVLDVGELPREQEGEPGKPFYTMELLSGEDLAHAIGGGSITPRDAVEVTRQVALALAYAHGRGVLHRDVKPQNIFLRAEAHSPPPTADAPTVHANAATAKTLHAMLVDFGLAKFIEREYAGREDARRAESLASLTQSGQVLGTPVYMAPEQVKGSRDVDARADVYALGATLYHMLTGQPPITGNSLAELLQAAQTVEPVSPRKRNARVDRDVETLCLKCLAKEPEGRYATAADLAEDCRRYLAGEPLVARPVGRAGRIWRRARRAPAVAATIGTLVCLLAAALVGLISVYLPARVRLTTDPPRAHVTALDRSMWGDGWVWPPGGFVLRVTADGFEPAEVPVQAPPGRTVHLGTVRLDPKNGFLDLTAYPEGVAVTVPKRPGGRDAEQVYPPIRGVALPPGDYVVRSEKADHIPRERVVRVDSEKRTQVHLTLAPQVLWRWSPKDGVPYCSGRLVDLDRDGLLDCVVSADRVYALSGGDGRVLWTSPFDPRPNAGPPALADLDRDGELDVAVYWQHPQAHGLRMLRGEDGSPIWEMLLPGAPCDAPCLADVNGDHVPDCLLGVSSGGVFALSGTDGNPLWSFGLEGMGDVALASADLDGDGSPDALLTATRPVLALKGRDGAPMWRWQGGDFVRSAAFADLDGDAADDCIFETGDGKVIALAGKDGSERWTVEFATVPGLALADLDADGTPDCVACGTANEVRVLSGRDGRTLWSRTTTAAPCTGPSIGDVDRDGLPDCAVGVSDGTVQFLSGRDGTQLGEYNTGSSATSAPVLGDINGDGLLDALVTCTDMRVHAISTRDEGLVWATPPVLYSESGLRFCSFDEDSVLDAMFTDTLGRTVVLRGTDGATLWISPGEQVHTYPPMSDLDGDGCPDSLGGEMSEEDSWTTPIRAQSGGRVLWEMTAIRFPMVQIEILGDLDGDSLPDPLFVLGRGAGASFEPEERDPDRWKVSGEVRALSGKGGRLLWSARGSLFSLLATANLDGDGVVDLVLESEDVVLAHSGRDGGKLWESRAGVGAAPPPTAVFVVRGGGTTHRYFPPGGEAIVVAPESEDQDGDGAPDLFAGTGRGQVHLLSGRTGLLLWTATGPGPVSNIGSPGDLDGDAHADVVGLTGPFIASWSGRDGTEIWRKRVGDSVTMCSWFEDVDADKVPDIALVFRRADKAVAAASDAIGIVRVMSGKDGRVLLCHTPRGSASEAFLVDLDADRRAELLYVTPEGGVELIGLPSPPGRARADPSARLAQCRRDQAWSLLHDEAESILATERDSSVRHIARTAKALACLQLGQYERALESLAEARRDGLRSSEAAVYEFLAAERWPSCSASRREEAAASLRDAFAVDPDTALDALVDLRGLLPPRASAPLRDVVGPAAKEGRARVALAVLERILDSNALSGDSEAAAFQEVLSGVQRNARKIPRELAYLAVLSLGLGRPEEFMASYPGYRELSPRPPSLDQALEALLPVAEARVSGLATYGDRRADRPGWLSFVEGLVNEGSGELEPALDNYRAALATAPSDEEYRRALAQACNNLSWRLATGEGWEVPASQEQDPKKAADPAQEAISVEMYEYRPPRGLDPEVAATLGEEAVSIAREFVQRTSGPRADERQILSMYLDTLAVAYAARNREGDMDRAIQSQEEALQLGPPEADRAVMQERLEKYRSRARR